MSVFLAEVAASLNRLPMVFYFAWGDTKARYRRSILGPFWIVLSTAIGVVGLGFLWSALLHIDKATFIPSLTVGLVIWQLLSGCITESPSVLVRYSGIIRNIKAPLFIYPMQLILRQLINFAHNCLVILVVLLIYPPPFLGLAELYALPGLVLVIANLLWLSALLGMLGARFRDIELFIGSIMPMLFFISPVIYRPSQGAINSLIIWFNPLTYMITAIRDPILGDTPPLAVYAVLTAILVVGWALTALLYTLKYRRISFWV